MASSCSRAGDGHIRHIVHASALEGSGAMAQAALQFLREKVDAAVLPEAANGLSMGAMAALFRCCAARAAALPGDAAGEIARLAAAANVLYPSLVSVMTDGAPPHPPPPVGSFPPDIEGEANANFQAVWVPKSLWSSPHCATWWFASLKYVHHNCTPNTLVLEP